MQVCHALSIPGRQVLKAGNLMVGRDIGVFKCDIATVCAAPGNCTCLIYLFVPCERHKAFHLGMPRHIGHDSD